MGRKRKDNTEAKVHQQLEGLDIKINEFGEIVSNISIEKINEFLNKNVADKKLINRHDGSLQEGLSIEKEEPKDDDDLDFDALMQEDDLDIK